MSSASEEHATSRSAHRSIEYSIQKIQTFHFECFWSDFITYAKGTTGNSSNSQRDNRNRQPRQHSEAFGKFSKVTTDVRSSATGCLLLLLLHARYRMFYQFLHAIFAFDGISYDWRCSVWCSTTFLHSGVIYVECINHSERFDPELRMEINIWKFNWTSVEWWPWPRPQWK